MDARPGEDGGGGTGGLTLRFHSDQDVPGETAPGRSLEEVDFRAYTVRAIGDAAPGDERTTRMDARIRWQDGEQPELIRFETAPQGLYSSIEVRILGDGEDGGYEITGEVEIEAIPRRFELTGEELPTITIPVEANLPPGGSVTITIPVDLASIINGLDFTDCTLVGEELDCSALGDEVDAAIAAAFAPDGAPAGPD